VVLTKRYEEGEMVPAGSSIGTVADRSDMWVKVYVPSAQLGRIRLGQSADVRVDAYPDRVFPGRISHVNQEAEYTPRQSLSERERTNLVFAVKVKVDGRDGVLKPGMPADVRIEAESR
jgi:HlyD family secretion protein